MLVVLWLAAILQIAARKTHERTRSDRRDAVLLESAAKLVAFVSRLFGRLGVTRGAFRLPEQRCLCHGESLVARYYWVSLHRQAPGKRFASRIAVVLAAILTLVVIDHLNADSAWTVLWTLGSLGAAAVAVRWVG